jgi:hypothetical protein
MLQGKDVLAGLLFIAIAACGLWVSQAYPVGTAWAPAICRGCCYGSYWGSGD